LSNIGRRAGNAGVGGGFVDREAPVSARRDRTGIKKVTHSAVRREMGRV